jgi:hypothetical protein|tara:strand:- start:15 stop:479 length:465 start_codon:yes stop_codon:yes gene_type:complete
MGQSKTQKFYNNYKKEKFEKVAEQFGLDADEALQLLIKEFSRRYRVDNEVYIARFFLETKSKKETVNDFILNHLPTFEALLYNKPIDKTWPKTYEKIKSASLRPSLKDYQDRIDKITSKLNRVVETKEKQKQFNKWLNGIEPGDLKKDITKYFI